MCLILENYFLTAMGTDDCSGILHTILEIVSFLVLLVLTLLRYVINLLFIGFMFYRFGEVDTHIILHVLIDDSLKIINIKSDDISISD